MLAAELVRALRESGTGPGKLEQMRAYLRDNPNATARELFNDLVTKYEAGQLGLAGTLEKAESLIMKGHLPKREVIANIEDQILEGSDTAPAPAPAAASVPGGQQQADTPTIVDDSKKVVGAPAEGPQQAGKTLPAIVEKPAAETKKK